MGQGGVHWGTRIEDPEYHGVHRPEPCCHPCVPPGLRKPRPIPGSPSARRNGSRRPAAVAGRSGQRIPEQRGEQRSLRVAGRQRGFVATAVGAFLAIGLRDISTRTQDSMLGFAAGMMLAASAFSLILPGLAAGRELFGNGPAAAATVVAGLGLGVLLMLGLDYFTPHEHESTGPCGPECERLNRVWLFVLAIALHNIPEGMAIGVSFANGDMSVGLPLTTAISIRDIPEGLAVALALRTTGCRRWRRCWSPQRPD